MSDATQLISVLREAATAVRAVAQTLRGAMQAVRAASVTGGRPSVAANFQAGNGAEERRAGTPALLGGANRAPIALPLALPRSAHAAALSGDFARALQGVLRSVIGQLTRLATGGGAGATGLGGSLLSGLLGGGLNLLLGRLIDRRAGGPTGLRADGPQPLPSLRSFPQLVLPGYASAPASALFGRRAVPRSPGISVSVEYKRGADDFVVAKVAQRLSELNTMENL